jgi:hypothetical protein
MGDIQPGMRAADDVSIFDLIEWPAAVPIGQPPKSTPLAN